MDMAKWYYVVGGTSTSGDRFSVPGAVCFTTLENNLGSEGYQAGFLDCQYVIEFAGAAVTSLSLSSSIVPPTDNRDTPRPKDEDASGYVRLARPLISIRK